MYTSEFQVELILELGFSFNGSQGKKGGGEGRTRMMAKGTGREERRERMNSDVFKYFKK